MNRLLGDWTLTAQRSRLDEVTSVFRNRPSQIDTQYVLTGLLVLAAIVLGMWLLSQLLARQERRRSYNSAWMLFLSLSKAHRLSWPDRWLLWRVARHQGLRDPARLFLEPERLADNNLGPALRLRGAQLKGLRGRLFAGLESRPDSGKRGQDPFVRSTLRAVPAKGSCPLFPGSPPSPGEPSPPQTAAEPPSLSFPIADNPALDVPPWAPQSDARSP